MLTGALSFGNAKGLSFAPNDRNLNVLYEAFATVVTAFARIVLDALSRST
jgi:hypothetical protein